MDEDKITITDPNYREPVDERIQRELDEYNAEKLRRAEEKENAMFEADWARYEKRATRRKKFLDGIKKIFARKNNEIQKQSSQTQR
ncbi:MAG: hypothetical protein J6L70_04590 [Alphaproteobacteria bacterium]|nr:hypothetical protein [Alphaproteobacteria bacterium]